MGYSHIIEVQAKRYPAMEISDLIKLAQQSEFGPGHLTGEENLEDLHAEFTQATEEGYAPPYTVEAIGDGMCRFHLDPRKLQKDDLELVARCFRASARPRGCGEGLWRKLGTIGGLIATEKLSCSVSEWENFLFEYASDGCPTLHHSDTYRSAYRPHYRVMDRDWAVYFPALRAIETALRGEKPVIVAVDGRCAAGKTTFAARLLDLYGESCAIFHMDDYFLPPEKRTAERLAAPGGNIDYERCAEELFLPLSRGEKLALRAFDCTSGILGEVQETCGKQLNVVEGSYALHPALAEHSQVHIFLTCPASIQISRLTQRESREDLNTFRNQWIPLEENYIQEFSIPDHCNAVIDTGKLTQRE